MNFANLADKILAVAKAAAPLVGLADEVEAGSKLVGSIEDLVEAFKADGGEISDEDLAELRAKVNAHADKTAADLRGG